MVWEQRRVGREKLTEFSFASISGQTSCLELGWAGLPSRGSMRCVISIWRKGKYPSRLSPL